MPAQDTSAKDDAAPERGPLSKIGQLASFLFAGVVAIVRFFVPRHEASETEVEPEPKPPPGSSVADRVEELAAKAAPFPIQDG